jgi:HSP20 family protein
MSMVRRTSPFGELLSLRQAMDRLFEESYVRPRSWSYGNGDSMGLPLDIYTTQDALVVEASMPGVKPEDVDITVTGDALTISGSTGEERESERDGVLFQEIRRGSFSRTVTLPAALRTDAATADFENGVLRLSIPKAEEAKPRQIKISAGHDGQSRQGGQADRNLEGTRQVHAGEPETADAAANGR